VVRPEIQITPASRAVNVDKLDAQVLPLLASVYQRGMALVEVAVEDRPQLLAAGTPTIAPLNVHALGTLIDRAAQCFTWNSKRRQYEAAACPDKLALLPLMHARRWRNARPISSVVESPFFRPDGTVWQTAGYDAGTGFLYQPNAEFPMVPENPTQDDARKALISLQHVFCDFPYTSEAAAAVPIACLLTILTRAAVDGNVPVFAFEASIQGSGKTMQGDVVHIIATGRLPPHSSWPEDEDEQGKRILSIALSGAPVMFLDNVKGLFGGAPIEAIVTSGELRQRLLGSSHDAVVRWLATLIVTGNNMRMTEDMLRRSLVCRVEPNEEDPSKRKKFEHDDLPGWVMAERERLVVCALTILRAYAVKGCPDTGCGTMQSFHAWSRLVPGAIRFAGGPNVLEAVGNSEDAGTDEAMATAIVVRELERLSTTPLAAREIIALLYPKHREPGEVDGWDEMRESVEALTNAKPGFAPSSKALGQALSTKRGQVSAGKRLRSSKLNGHTRWYVEGVKRG
jgi:hypothetical protein